MFGNTIINFYILVAFHSKKDYHFGQPHLFILSVYSYKKLTHNYIKIIMS